MIFCVMEQCQPIHSWFCHSNGCFCMLHLMCAKDCNALAKWCIIFSAWYHKILIAIPNVLVLTLVWHLLILFGVISFCLKQHASSMCNILLAPLQDFWRKKYTDCCFCCCFSLFFFGWLTWIGRTDENRELLCVLSIIAAPPFLHVRTHTPNQRTEKNARNSKKGAAADKVCIFHFITLSIEWVFFRVRKSFKLYLSTEGNKTPSTMESVVLISIFGKQFKVLPWKIRLDASFYLEPLGCSLNPE